MRIVESRIHPLVRPVVGENLNGKLQLTVERCPVLAAIDEDEVSAPRNLEPALPQEPLIDIHLTLESLLPFVIERNLLLGCSRLVVHDDQLAVLALPYVVHCSGDEEIRFLVEILHTGEIRPPLIQIVMRERHRIDLVLLHERVRLAFGAMDIEFLLEQVVDSNIECERRPRHPTDAQPPVEVEATGTLKEQFYLAAAELEGLFGLGIEEAAGTGHFKWWILLKDYKLHMQFAHFPPKSFHLLYMGSCDQCANHHPIPFSNPYI